MQICLCPSASRLFNRARLQPKGAAALLSRRVSSLRSSESSGHYDMTLPSNSQAVKFGKFDIQRSEIFLESKLSFAFVNLKPVVPGHLLVSPKRVVPRFGELNLEEVADLWTLAQRVGRAAEAHFKANSLTLAIQDGPEAGQTVPHVHVHVLPRRPGDFENNDDVYEAIDEGSKHLVGEKLDLDKERRIRTHQEMAEEAAELRVLF